MKQRADLSFAITKTLSEPADKVFRLTGILPQLPGGEDEQMAKELMEIFKNLPPEEQQNVLDYARFRYQKKRE